MNSVILVKTLTSEGMSTTKFMKVIKAFAIVIELLAGAQVNFEKLLVNLKEIIKLLNEMMSRVTALKDAILGVSISYLRNDKFVSSPLFIGSFRDRQHNLQESH